jgi:rod shape determining protein RodA
MGKMELQGTVKVDYALLFSFIVLVILGILTIYSTGSGSADVRGVEKQHLKQIYWALFGVAVFIMVLFVNYQKMGEYVLIIYGACILVLVLTLLVGKRVRGAKSWISFAGGVGFQPSEFVKIGFVITLAKFLDSIGEEIKKLKYVMLALLLTMLPMGLILLQPDFGTALVFIPIVLVMLFFGGIRINHLVSIIITFGIAVTLPLVTTFGKLTRSPSLSFLAVLDDTKVILFIAMMFGIMSFVVFVIYRVTKKDIIFKAINVFIVFFAGLLLAAMLGKFLRPYQKERLVVFLRPTIDPFGAGYNIIQSKIAIGAGGFFGKGLMGGTQSQLGFLPERSTDFVFAIFAEAWGFMGSFFLLALYAIFLYRGIMTIFTTREFFGHLIAAGIVGMLLFHIIVNIGMTIGVMPITGLPLPFMSYGGSFLITCLAATSLLMNIQMRRFTH